MSLGPLNPRKSGLGSLAQSARSKKLNQARWLLIIIGGITIVFNAILIATLRSQGFDDQTVRLNTIVGIFTIVLGAVFVFLGIIVHAFPVAATVIALVLYVGATAIFGVLNPEFFVRGIIFKVIIIVGLSQGIVAAVAYQKEQNAARQLEPEPEYE